MQVPVVVPAQRHHALAAELGEEVTEAGVDLLLHGHQLVKPLFFQPLQL